MSSPSPQLSDLSAEERTLLYRCVVLYEKISHMKKKVASSEELLNNLLPGLSDKAISIYVERTVKVDLQSR